MVSAPIDHGDDSIFDDFLSQRGHETAPVDWNVDYNKKQCPECGGLHDVSATECSVCGWEGPNAN